jgi:hypothetical protein
VVTTTVAPAVTTQAVIPDESPAAAQPTTGG